MWDADNRSILRNIFPDPKLTETLTFHISPRFSSPLAHSSQRVALSFCGYGDPSNWTRAQDMLLNTPDRGRKWLQGGWKDEPLPVGAEWDVDVDIDTEASTEDASEAGIKGSDSSSKEEKSDKEVYRRARAEGARLKAGLDGLREVVSSVRKV